MRRRRTTRWGMWTAGAAVLALFGSGCWLAGWLEFFQFPNSSDAYRVRDMRVLAIEAEPAGLLVDPRIPLFDPTEPPFFIMPTEPIELEVNVRAFDPRGGEVSVSLQLCPGPEAVDTFAAFGSEPAGVETLVDVLDACEALDLDDVDGPWSAPEVRRLLAPRTRTIFAQTELDPYGPIGGGEGIVEAWSITPTALLQLATLIDGELADFNGGFLYVVAKLSKAVDDGVESEVAVLPLELRLDISHRNLPGQLFFDLLEDSGGFLCAPDAIVECFGSVLPIPPTCGNGIVDENVGEQCDPPGEDGCRLNCTLLEFLGPGCDAIDACILLPVATNEPPRLVGVRVLEPDESSTELLVVDDSGAEQATAAVGEPLVLDPGQPVRLAPVLHRDSLQIYQRTLETIVYPDEEPSPDGGGELEPNPDVEPEPVLDGGGEDDPGFEVVPRMTTLVDVPCVLWFLVGDDGQLLGEDGEEYEASFCFADPPTVTFVPPEDRAAGDTDLLRMTAGDARGGMAVVEVPIIYR